MKKRKVKKIAKKTTEKKVKKMIKKDKTIPERK